MAAAFLQSFALMRRDKARIRSARDSDARVSAGTLLFVMRSPTCEY